MRTACLIVLCSLLIAGCIGVAAHFYKDAIRLIPGTYLSVAVRAGEPMSKPAPWRYAGQRAYDPQWDVSLRGYAAAAIIWGIAIVLVVALMSWPVQTIVALIIVYLILLALRALCRGRKRA